MRHEPAVTFQCDFTFPGDVKYSHAFPGDIGIGQLKEELWRVKDTQIPNGASLKGSENYSLRYLGPEGLLVELLDEIQLLYV